MQKADDFTDINKICETLDGPFCKSLIGIQSFTGCDTRENCFDVNKEKEITSFLKWDSSIIHALPQMSRKVTESVFENVEKLVCSMCYKLESCSDDLSSLRWNFERIRLIMKDYHLQEGLFHSIDTRITLRHKYEKTLWRKYWIL